MVDRGAPAKGKTGRRIAVSRGSKYADTKYDRLRTVSAKLHKVLPQTPVYSTYRRHPAVGLGWYGLPLCLWRPARPQAARPPGLVG